jgi:hypothetical protein
MDKKIHPISFAVPGALRNLTKEKVPATATDAPKLPLTIMMTTATIAGIIARVFTKDLE